MIKQFELTPRHIRNLLDFANAGKNDIFYDLGCGKGLPVIMAISYSKVKMAIGIESELEVYEYARKSAISKLSKKQLNRIDFSLGFIDSDHKRTDNSFIYDFSDGSIVYYSLEEDENDMEFYKKRLNWKKVKLIKKDIPLVGYESKANRANNDCWFFMMRFPFKRIKDKNMWASSVMGKDNSTVDDVYEYYKTLLEKRYVKIGWTKKEAHQDTSISIKNLKKLVCLRFC